MLDFVSDAFEMDTTLFIVTEDLRIDMFIATMDLHLLPSIVDGVLQACHIVICGTEQTLLALHSSQHSTSNRIVSQHQLSDEAH